MSVVVSILLFFAIGHVILEDDRYHRECQSVVRPCIHPNVVFGMEPENLLGILIVCLLVSLTCAGWKYGMIRK